MEHRYTRQGREELFQTILRYQDLDSLFRLGVVLCNIELQGDGCSLFLRNSQGEFELKESTFLSRFLGQPLELDFKDERSSATKIRNLLERQGIAPEDLSGTLTLDATAGWDPELIDGLKGYGLTRWAVQQNCPVMIDRINEDIRWSSFDAVKSMLNEVSPPQHCELRRTEMGSFVATPLTPPVEGDSSGDGRLPLGVLRTVRRRGQPPFEQQDLAWLIWFREQIECLMLAAVSLDDLMDLSAKLEIEDFGDSLVQLLCKVLRARGCSIFLELDTPRHETRTFRCIATTGLFEDGQKVPKEEAFYEVRMDQVETSFLTGWTIRNGQMTDVDSSHEFDEERFPDLCRQSGRGKYSESEPHDTMAPGGPLLICPLFLHQGREVAGAIRLVRPRIKEQSFEAHEKLLFLDISRRLSRVLTNLNLRQVSERLIELYDRPKEMMRQVPKDVCRLLGVEGCSVFQRSGMKLSLVATQGLLEREEDEITYDISDPKLHGWTGWVAQHKRALRLNSPEEAERVDATGIPQHSSQDLHLPCEVVDRNQARRFLAVPIFKVPEDPESEVLGVIRASRRNEDPPFDEVHESILVSFAARLSLALNMSRRNEVLEEIAELANPARLLDNVAQESGRNPNDPVSIADEVIRRAVDILMDRLDFPLVSIYQLEDKTGVYRKYWGRSVDDDVPPPDNVEQPRALGLHQYTIRINKRNLGMLLYQSPDGQMPTESQKNLVGLVAGVCGSALYNARTFEQLSSLRQGLVEIGEEMTQASRLDEKLKKIADVAARVTSANNVIIHEYVEPEQGSTAALGVFRQSAWGGSEEPRNWSHSDFEEGGAPFKIVRQKEPIFAEVAKESKFLFLEGSESSFIIRERVKSAAATRLDVQGRCLGCIFFNFRHSQKFDPQQRREIEMMADWAAVAIQQGRLLEETRQLVDEKKSLLRYADHSLAQPINALVGFLSNLSDGVYPLAADCLPPGVDGRTDLLRKAEQQHRLCKYVVYLIKMFLSIDDVDSKVSFEIKKESNSNLSDVCAEAVSVADVYAGLDVERDIETEVIGCFDPTVVQMTLLNILINAVRYGCTDVSGSLLRVRLVTFDEFGLRWARICIDDSGPGIDAAHRRRVFEKGYKQRPEASGLGIGLYLSKGYIEVHGGRIHVEESDLGGARFVVEVPLDQNFELT